MSSKYFIKELWKYQEVARTIGDINIVNELLGCGGFEKDALRLVGVFFTSTGDVVYCCPKYMSDEDILNANKGNTLTVEQHIQLLVKVLDKLRAEGRNIPEISYDLSIFNRNSNKKRINRYSVAKAIVIDYLEYGIYFRNVKELGKDTRGKVNWAATIKKTDPIISNKSIIYPSLLRKKNYKNYSEQVTIIHQNIVYQCIEYLKGLGEYGTLANPEIDIRLKPYDMEKHISYLNECLVSAYSNREIALFKMMISWCGESPFYKGRGCTTSFQHVWEWTNDRVFGNVEQKFVKSAVPMYYLDGKELEGTGNAEPDTISSIEIDGIVNVAIFDSKYYVPSYIGAKSVTGLPTSHDIVKQIAYKQCIEEECGTEGITYANVFLFPTNTIYREEYKLDEKHWYLMVGYVKNGRFEALKRCIGIENSGHVSKEYIGIMLISPEKLFFQYLKGGWVGKEAIKHIVEQYEKITG